MTDSNPGFVDEQVRPSAPRWRYKRNVRPPPSMSGQFDFLLLVISLIVFAATGLALIEVLPGDGAMTNLKVAFFAVTCGVLSYFGNKISIHKLAELAAYGYRAALVAAIVWFTIFGLMVATLTHTALSWKQIAEVELREAGAHIATIGSSATNAGLAGQQVRPELEGVKSRIDDSIACEVARGCLTGKPGRGPAVTVLERIRGQIDDVVRQFRDADGKRQQMGQRLVAIGSNFEKAQANGALGYGEKRAALLAIYFEAERVAAELFAVTPATAIKGLAADLRSVRLPGGLTGSVDITSALSDYASRLESTASVDTAKVALPPFPAPPAITAGWRRLDITWPYLFLAIALEGAVIYAFVSILLQFKALDDSDPVASDRADPKDGLPVGGAVVRTQPSASANGDARFTDDGTQPRAPRPRHT